MKAIISVWSKAGVVDLAKRLNSLGADVYSTGGTKKILAGADVPVHSISELTGFPEIMDGRVKTLHPAVHGGILARRHMPSDLEQLAGLGIGLIDMVVVNLYPFVETISKPDIDLATALENIDIGGPTMVRAAAKNFPDVLIMVDPADYDEVLSELESTGSVRMETRRALAAKAFQHVALYDTHISHYLGLEDRPFSDRLTLALEKLQDLRYGENPHQKAAFYRDALVLSKGSGIAGARQLNGKELSYNNILDADAALQAAYDFATPTIAIIKHTNPCGLASGENLIDVYRRALAGDPVAAYGGIVACNRPVDSDLATEISKTFFEVMVAPSYTEGALEQLRTRGNLRVLAVESAGPKSGDDRSSLSWRKVSGGFLAQTPDALPEDSLTLRVVTDRAPTTAEEDDLRFAWRAAKHVKSNAILLASKRAVVGMGAGQPSRVESVAIALRVAKDRASGSVLASDAFFPFPDGVEAACRGGVTAIIQPGGSTRDEEAIRVANEHNVAMVFTGERHFLH